MLTKPRRLRRLDAIVGRNIRALRLQRGLSQANLGKYLNVTQQQIQLYEKGANCVAAGQLGQVAAALGVPLEILTDTSPTAPDLTQRALAANTQALRLLKSFQRIPSLRTREAVMLLIESVGEEQSNVRSRLRS
jgi:transcriptional regulator with XRE-family HTH domain